MLLETLEYWLTPCPRPVRAMGYLREQIAIDARLRRNRSAWAPHLEATREAILFAAERCVNRRCVLVLGAGLHHDLPLEALAARFEIVLLADLLHRPSARRRAKAFGRGVRCVEFDVSGVLAGLYAEGINGSESEILARVCSAEIGLPAGVEAEPDLVVSANLCAQLMLLPGEWLARRREFSEGFHPELEKVAAQRHLAWLRERSGVQALITETQRLRISPSGEELECEQVPGLETLPAPDRDWLWRLAPIPECSRDYHREHRVGFWCSTREP